MKLHLLRHAKTDQNSSTGKDFDRKLLKKGKDQSAEMGKYFQVQKFNPSKIICSSAARTRETAAVIQKYHTFNAKIEFNDEIYLTEKEKLFSLISSIDDVGELFIIGHNNGLSDLASYLVDDFIDLSTCDFVTIQFKMDAWEEISKGLGTVIERFHPSV
jgi:phosphohistidine phosphatase